MDSRFRTLTITFDRIIAFLDNFCCGIGCMSVSSGFFEYFPPFGAGRLYRVPRGFKHFGFFARKSLTDPSGRTSHATRRIVLWPHLGLQQELGNSSGNVLRNVYKVCIPKVDIRTTQSRLFCLKLYSAMN